MAKNKIKMKHLRTGYLYKDGHFIGWYEERVRKHGVYVPFSWVEAYQSIGVETRFDGRVIFSDGALWLLKHPDLVQVTAVQSEGSKISQELGIKIVNFKFTFKAGIDNSVFFIPTMPDVVSSAIRYQPERTEVWENLSDDWGFNNMQVIKHYTKGENNESTASA